MASKKLLLDPAGAAVANTVAGEALIFKREVLSLLLDHGMIRGVEGEHYEGEYEDDDEYEDGEGRQLADSQSDFWDDEQAQAQAAALLQRLVIEARPDGLHVRAKRWEEEESEEYEEEESRCVDLHPMCEAWADEGECEANPGYMVGTAVHQGHCLRACGMCSPPPVSFDEGEDLQADGKEQGSHTIDPSFLAQLQAIINNRVLALKQGACVSGAKSCMSAQSTTSRGAGLVVGGSGGLSHTTERTLNVDGDDTPVMKTSGFVLGKPSWGQPLVQKLSLSSKRSQQARNQQQIQQQQEQQQQQQQQQQGTGVTGIHANEALQQKVDDVLQRELSDKLFLLPAEFFIFEYLYRNHTRHFHEEKIKGGELKVTEDWALGTFARERVIGGTDSRGRPPLRLQEKDLLPVAGGEPMSSYWWPYVHQKYEGGDECILAKGRRAIRNTEVRIACSPDDRVHLLVREPDFCSYIFVLYVPALCELPEYLPVPVRS